MKSNVISERKIEMEKKPLVISCANQMLPGWCLNVLADLYDLNPLSCLLNESLLPDILGRKMKVIYGLGGQERLFGKAAEAVAKNAERLIFIGEQPDTYIDLAFFKERGIPVLKTGGGAFAVAEKTFKQITDPDSLRDWAGKRSIAANGFDEQQINLLQRQKVSIIGGTGKMGRMILNKLKGIAGELCFAGGRDERKRKELEDLGFVYEPDLAKAFDADSVSVHITYIPGITEKIFSKTHLAQIRKHGRLFNNARAELFVAEDVYEVSKERGYDVEHRWDVSWKEGWAFQNLKPGSIHARIHTMPNFHFGHHSAAFGDPQTRGVTLGEYGEGFLKAAIGGN